jgi:hypothetical protein
MKLFPLFSALLFATVAESAWSADGPTKSQREEAAPTAAGGAQNAIPLGRIKDGTEYEHEFEYEYDWGTIARFEPLLGRAMPTSSGRLLRDGQFPGSKTLSAIALDPPRSFSFPNRTRTRTRPRTRFLIR